MTLEPKTKVSNGKALYYENPASKGIEIPFLPSTHHITYSEYYDAYVIDKGFFDPANTDTTTFRILERNGTLKRVPYPQEMLKGRMTLYPVKVGYVAKYSSGKSTYRDPGDRGLWLLQGQKAKRLIVGAIDGISVSPDGCKVAFMHARNNEEYFSRKGIPYSTVKMINFCEGEIKR